MRHIQLSAFDIIKMDVINAETVCPITNIVGLIKVVVQHRPVEGQVDHATSISLARLTEHLLHS